MALCEDGLLLLLLLVVVWLGWVRFKPHLWSEGWLLLQMEWTV